MKKLKSITSLFLIIISLLTLLPLDAYAIDPVNVWVSGGGTGGGGAKATTKGVWDNDYQGLRITVLDYAGMPAFTFAGKEHLDLLFSYPYQCSYYEFSNKTSFSRTMGINRSDLTDSCFLTTISELVTALWHWDTTGYNYAKDNSEGSSRGTVENLQDIPKPLYQDNKGNWHRQGKAIKDKLYGLSDTNIDDEAALYCILNLTYHGIFFWEPKMDAYLGKNPFTSEEVARLKLPKDDPNRLTPISLMRDKGLVISIEPIIWNQLRISQSQFSKYSVYGTQTGLGSAIQALINANADIGKSSYAQYGGYDTSLFGAEGRKSMILTKGMKFGQYMNKDGEIKGSSFTISPPKDSGQKVTNYKVLQACDKPDEKLGWSIHLYWLKKDDKTHTWDNINFPPDDYKEGPAPEKPEGKYNIVKFYEQLINEEDDVRDKEAEFRHIVTYERTDTVPIIKIECETHEKIAPANYEVIEWKWSDQEKPDITPDLKWTDEPIASIPALDGRCGDKCTEDEQADKQYIDIKEDGTKDTETVTTL